MTLSLRTVAGFFGRWIVVYGLAIAPWPGLAEAYSRAFRACANGLFGSLGSAGAVRFEAGGETPAGDSSGWTSELLVANRDSGASGSNDFNTRPAYLSTSLLVALILATPIPWRRRLRALGFGLLWIHLLLAAWILLGLVNIFSNGGALALFQLAPRWKQLLVLASRTATISLETTFPLPLGVWALATLRAEDFTGPTDPPRQGPTIAPRDPSA